MICPECGKTVPEVRNVYGKSMCQECCNKDTRFILLKFREAGLIESVGDQFRITDQGKTVFKKLKNLKDKNPDILN